MGVFKIFVNGKFYENFNINFMRNIKKLLKINYFFFSHKFFIKKKNYFLNQYPEDIR